MYDEDPAVVALYLYVELLGRPYGFLDGRWWSQYLVDIFLVVLPVFPRFMPLDFISRNGSSIPSRSSTIPIGYCFTRAFALSATKRRQQINTSKKHVFGRGVRTPPYDSNFRKLGRFVPCATHQFNHRGAAVICRISGYVAYRLCAVVESCFLVAVT